MTVRITNYRENDTINVSLPLIKGEVIAGKDSKLFVQNQSSNSDPVIWPVINGKFKVLIPLISGKNKIKFDHKKSILNFTLTYTPLKFDRFVRLIYIKCKDDPGHFQAPCDENSSIQSACNRICLAGQMLQTFTLDKLQEHGLNCKTFQIEEENNKVLCHVFTSSLTLKEAHELGEQELWSHFAVELMNSKLRMRNNCKFLAFLSFTRYINKSNSIPQTHQEILSMTKGQVALGGSGLALFGSGCLHTWAERVQEVPWRFGDKRKINRLKFMDDSANRGFHWACYSTGLGATLHELGHTFDLGHTNGGIMGRGFDDIYKYFIIDMFYHDHIFQKEHNPFYQKSLVQNCSVPLSLTSPISWQEPLNKSLENFHLSTETSKISTQNSGTEIPWKLPNPPDSYMEYGKFAVNVGGAYWSRSSALILYFHKWFNDFEEENKNSISLNGTKLVTANGIKVIEFRDEVGTSFHHLEFLEETKTEIDISSFNVIEYVPDNNKEISFIAEDKLGNIIKSKFNANILLASN